MAFDWPNAQHVYLSPHLDDVVLSCGGLLFDQVRRGESAAVITVFAGSPPATMRLSSFARGLHRRWQGSTAFDLDFSDPPAVRRKEDQAAFAAIDPAIEVHHLPYPDCIYRADETGTFLYDSEAGLFGPIAPRDPALTALRNQPPPPGNTIVYIPLGVGGHVDHKLVRAAADRWPIPASVRRYYEEYPYAEDSQAVQLALAEDKDRLEALTYPLNTAARDAKVRAVAQHASQISTFWQDVERMAAAIDAYHIRTGGETLWCRVND